MHRILQQPRRIGESTKRMSQKLFQLLIISVLIATFVRTRSFSVPYGNSKKIIAADVSLGLREDETDQAWEDYKNRFKGSIYLDGSDERREIFYETHRRIQEHNRGKSSFRKGHNQFSIMTQEERQRYLGFRFPDNKKELKVNTI